MTGIADGNVHKRRSLLGDLITKSDPMLKEKTQSTGGGITVDDDWGAVVYDYANNGFKGAYVAADQVSGSEDQKPAMEIGGELLDQHRHELGDLLKGY